MTVHLQLIVSTRLLARIFKAFTPQASGQMQLNPPTTRKNFGPFERREEIIATTTKAVKQLPTSSIQVQFILHVFIDLFIVLPWLHKLTVDACFWIQIKYFP